FSTAKSGGPGGQHVNKTESSVRVTHKPTGQVVRVSSQRSQHQNKRIAISMIFERIREEAELARIKQIQGLRNQRSTESYVRVYDLR
ncbi:peptide chain release factor family protein, partial [Shewanella algae]|uniref:peptide chain release factor family protein n=1 Tax=Shewanella algae TaxID=38313 RepID=UPI00313D009F